MSDTHRIEQARRSIAVDVLELRAVKLRLKALLASLERGYSELTEALGISVDDMELDVA